MTMPRKIAVLKAALLLVTLTVTGLACQVKTGGQSASAPEPEELEMVVYDTPPGAGQQLRGVLQQAFYRNEATPPVARATVSPDGRLLVIGPRSVQAGVATLMNSLGKMPATTLPTVEFKYWLVLGQPGTGEVPPDLAEISSALNAVSKAQGGLVFEALESLTLRSVGEEDGEANGRSVNVHQVASVAGGALVARIEIDPIGPTKLKTRVQLEPGQTMVLGESGFDLKAGHFPGLKPGPDTRKLFYVVRPTVIATKPAP